MKIVNLMGGLGNQMFEYAMFLALKKAHPKEKILCSTRALNGYSLHNGYELERIFDIETKEASLWQLTKLAYPYFNFQTWQVMHKWLPNRKSMTFETMRVPFDKNDVERVESMFYDGYWQYEEYFKDAREEILGVYQFPKFTDEPNKKLAKKLISCTSVACHVRRGDYLKHPVMCVCTEEYYVHAIEKMNNMISPDLYCVFSDDPEWCKENLAHLFSEMEVVYVNWNKGENSFRDMQLMTLCKHNIIANSSFSWWGAWLNQNEDKIVLTPEKWLNKNLLKDPICDNWIRIK